LAVEELQQQQMVQEVLEQTHLFLACQDLAEAEHLPGVREMLQAVVLEVAVEQVEITMVLEFNLVEQQHKLLLPME
jgi:hypothetical protein